MDKIKKYSDKEWEKLASLLSGETADTSGELNKLRQEDNFEMEKKWKEMGKTGNSRIDVDKAWRNIYSKIEENGMVSEPVAGAERFRIRTFIRIAASALILIGLGTAIFYMNDKKNLSNTVIVAANSSERNIEVSLPDGSKVFLNRNSEISYSKKMAGSARNVTLKGEAFFDVKHDSSRPFVIDAGKANIKVLGTSFSVITNNKDNAVEVYVKTGRVMLSDNAGNQTLFLDPGFIGTMDSKSYAKAVNENPNYLSWNTDLLFYENTKLSVVFSDLKKVFDINVVSDDPDILNIPLTTTFEKEPQDTIIRVICSTFSGSYRKDGNVYHLSKK